MQRSTDGTDGRTPYRYADPAANYANSVYVNKGLFFSKARFASVTRAFEHNQRMAETRLG